MGSALVCVVLGVGPKFEPNKFGGVGKRKAYNLPHRYHRLNTSYLGRGAQHARGRTGVHSRVYIFGRHRVHRTDLGHACRPRSHLSVTLCQGLNMTQGQLSSAQCGEHSSRRARRTGSRVSISSAAVAAWCSDGLPLCRRRTSGCIPPACATCSGLGLGWG